MRLKNVHQPHTCIKYARDFQFIHMAVLFIQVPGHRGQGHEREILESRLEREPGELTLL